VKKDVPAKIPKQKLALTAAPSKAPAEEATKAVSKTPVKDAVKTSAKDTQKKPATVAPKPSPKTPIKNVTPTKPKETRKKAPTPLTQQEIRKNYEVALKEYFALKMKIGLMPINAQEVAQLREADDKRLDLYWQTPEGKEEAARAKVDDLLNEANQLEHCGNDKEADKLRKQAHSIAPQYTQNQLDEELAYLEEEEAIQDAINDAKDAKDEESLQNFLDEMRAQDEMVRANRMPRNPGNQRTGIGSKGTGQSGKKVTSNSKATQPSGGNACKVNDDSCKDLTGKNCAPCSIFGPDWKVCKNDPYRCTTALDRICRDDSEE
jgi:hypothetical protein